MIVLAMLSLYVFMLFSIIILFLFNNVTDNTTQRIEFIGGAPSVLKAEYYVDRRGSKEIPSMFATNKTDFIPPPEAFDFSKALVFDNRVYIPLNINGRSVEHVGLIIGALNAFEKAYPELQVVPGSQEIKEHDGVEASSKTYGIWLDTWPKHVLMGPDD